MAQKFYRKKISIVAQEGDFPAPIVITVPESLPLAGYEVLFQVRNDKGRAFINKSTLENSIATDLQLIQIDFAKADTQGYSGTHEWELALSKPGVEDITIGGGKFIIEPTTIN